MRTKFLLLLALVFVSFSCNSCVDPPDIRFYTLTYLVEGRGSVVVVPDRALYSEGESVQITALANDPVWPFDQIKGDIVSSEPKVTVIMDRNLDFTVVFRHEPIPVERHDLHVSVVGQGRVEFNPTQPFGGYIEGTTVNVEAITDRPRWSFFGFANFGFQNPITVTMDQPIQLIATFLFTAPPAPQIVTVPEYYITVNRNYFTVSGSDFEIVEAGLYDLSVLLEYSARAQSQNEEHIFFRVSTGDSEIKPVTGNQPTGDFVVLDENNNVDEVKDTRNAGQFQLEIGKYQINAYHGSTIMKGTVFNGINSIHGFEFTWSWDQAQDRPTRPHLER